LACGMTIHLPATAILTREDEADLAKRIEAGVFAHHLLDAGACAAEPDGRDGRRRPAPTREELAAVAADGDAAWCEFFLANLRLVMLISARWARRYRLDVEDVFQEGCLGLAHALRRWDHRRGTKFCTLAWGQISWRVRRICIERAGASGAPSWWLDVQTGTRSGHTELHGQWGREPTVGELAEHLGQAVDVVARALTWEPPCTVAVLPEVPAPEVGASSPERELCVAGLARIPEQERRVIAAHWGLIGAPLSYEEVASAVGWPVRQVKAVEERGMARLRQVMGADDGAKSAEYEQLAWAA